MQPFEHVVAQHGATVLRVCRAALGPVDAEDAWSETFLAALRAYPTLGHETNLEAWLVTVAHRKAVDVLRRRSRDPVPAGRLPEPAAEDEHDAVEHSDLYAALDRLPTKQRLCVALHHLGGLPHREVAEVVGGSEEAARRASADGIKALRRSLPEVATVEPVPNGGRA